jgi:predicted dehydrogenase
MTGNRGAGHSPTGHNRRRFLQTSAALAAGSLVPLGLTGRARGFFAANDRPQIGQIGCGGQGNYITNRAVEFGDVVAVCDVDSQRAEQAKAKQGKGKAEVFGDYRKLLDRSDIDVVTIGTPDHWHSKIAIEAMQAGKDVYCEKPLTLTIDEGKLICKVAKETKKVFQVGTQQRSEGPFAQAAALCREGRLGKIQKILVAIGGGDKGGPFKKEKAPAQLNWDMWLGQTPKVDYIKERCHYQFRWWYEYSGGKMTDWGAHHVDVAHWILDAKDTSPVTFEGSSVEHPVPLKNGYPTEDDKYNTATAFRVATRFKDGTELIITHHINEEGANHGNGVLVIGDKGRIFVDRGKLVGRPVQELKENPLPEGAIAKVLKGQAHGHHMRNFFQCLESRKDPISDVYSHHRAMTTCHLANICIRLGRKLTWDPATEQIVGDEDAAKWVRREQRKGYEISV